MKRTSIACIALVLASAGIARAQVFGFDKDPAGGLPSGFSTALTGKGRPGSWVVMKDDAAPSAPNVLAQTDMDRTSYRFPLCIFDGVTAKDVDLRVKFKAVKGSGDQGAGLVWRYRDKDNYYIVRANALENNVVLYKVEKGRRTDLPLAGRGRTYGFKTAVRSGVWGALRVVARGSRFEVYFNDTKLFDVEDTTFAGAGKTGVWTKADSYILFDDFVITDLDK